MVGWQRSSWMSGVSHAGPDPRRYLRAWLDRPPGPERAGVWATSDRTGGRHPGAAEGLPDRSGGPPRAGTERAGGRTDRTHPGRAERVPLSPPRRGRRTTVRGPRVAAHRRRRRRVPRSAPAGSAPHRAAVVRARPRPARGIARAPRVAPNTRARPRRAKHHTTGAAVPPAGRPRVRGGAATPSGRAAPDPPRPPDAGRPSLATTGFDRGHHDRAWPGRDPARLVAST